MSAATRSISRPGTLFSLIAGLTACAVLVTANHAAGQACTPELKAEPVLPAGTDALAVGLR
jgi:hypothetical protein